MGSISKSSTYLIIGANRGIGKRLTTSLLLRPNTTVIAAVRDMTNSTPILEALPKTEGSNLILVKLDLNPETDPFDAAKEFGSKHPITHLDVLIANTGIAHSSVPISQNSASTLREHFAINTIAPILLFQAFLSLLKRSASPKFLALSTFIGSISAQDRLPGNLAPCDASKGTLNWVVKRIHVEEKWVCAYVGRPGLVLTDMSIEAFGKEGVRRMGSIAVERSVEGLLRNLDEATREKLGYVFKSWDGSVLPW